MLFNSYIFILVFLPIVACVYFLASTHLHRQLAISWLVIASLFFYAWWNPVFLPIIIVSVLFNFFLGASIRTTKAKNPRYALLLMLFGVAANLMALGYYKYFNFFIDNLNFVFNLKISVTPIALPLAISFFTFQQITYLIDAYNRGTKDYNFIHYTLFVTFFPQLIAGPIVHHADMMSQFDSDDAYHPRERNIQLGLSIFAIGLFKKIMLADNIAPFSTPIFHAADTGISLSMLESWMGAAAFGLQVYFDFSAYTDMAIGSSRLFGIKLPINFYSPYKSLNTGDLWRRWHMTLTRLLTAYVYTPISIASARAAIAAGAGEQALFWRSAAYPIMVTLIIAGVWHGAAWNFVIFGALQGGMMIVNNLWRQFRKSSLHQNLKETTLVGRILARGLTSVCFIFSLVYFKASTTSGALYLSELMLGLDGLSVSTKFVSPILFLQYAVPLFLIIYLMPNTQQLFESYEPSLEPKRNEHRWGLERINWAPNWQWAAICSTMFAVSLLNMNRVSEFIYFQF